MTKVGKKEKLVGQDIKTIFTTFIEAVEVCDRLNRNARGKKILAGV